MSTFSCRLNRSMQHFILNGKMERMQMKQRYGRGFSAADKNDVCSCNRRLLGDHNLHIHRREDTRTNELHPRRKSRFKSRNKIPCQY